MLGAGGQADETAEYALPEIPAFRAVSVNYLISGRSDIIDVEHPDGAFRAIPVVAAVGAPGLRRELVRAWPGTTYRTVVAPAAWVSRSASIGHGSILAPHSALNTNVSIGRHVVINLGASVSHDAHIGDFVTVSPGAHIGGRVRIDDGAFIGIGAVVSSNVHIASGIVVGAGCVVVADLTESGVYVGVPARWLGAQEGWLRVI
jgi:sugar O-acyltransferase (sialic acid O-acetyltransferase NeuD family)